VTPQKRPPSSKASRKSLQLPPTPSSPTPVSNLTQRSRAPRTESASPQKQPSIRSCQPSQEQPVDPPENTQDDDHDGERIEYYGPGPDPIGLTQAEIQFELSRLLNQTFNSTDADVEGDETPNHVPHLNVDIVLHPHQQHCRMWTQDREGGHGRGGIIADEMGLGKTLEMIVHIAGDGFDPIEELDNRKYRKSPVVPSGATLYVFL
jgi:SNF2 family DNA or RNA helicase